MNSCEKVVGTVQPTLKIIGSIESPLGGGGGQDGISPIVEITPIVGGNRLTITDVNGAHYADIMNGKDGEDGNDGYTPQKGVDYFDGKNGSDGKDGVSATHSWNGTTLTVTSASGTSSADLKGDTGTSGSDGVGIKSVVQTTTSSTDGGDNVITVTKTDNTTSTFTVKNGSKGSTGAPGANGADGKSAYAYAQDGGYTGTETEFSSDLSNISKKVDSTYLIPVFEELKTAIQESNIDNAIAILDRAILDLSKLS